MRGPRHAPRPDCLEALELLAASPAIARSTNVLSIT
jgi:hypothetical protein